MRVVVHLIYDPTGEESTRTVEILQTSSMHDLINDLGLPMAYIDHERYYLMEDIYWFYRIPYIIHYGKIRWYQDYHDALLLDFFNTHNIQEGDIYIRWWPVPGAGGYWPYEVYKAWEHFYEFLKGVDPILGTASTTIVGAKYLWTKLRNRMPPDETKDVWPSTFFSLLMSRSHWNTNELAELTGMRPDLCKEFLRACGYKWDRRKMRYIQTETTAEVLSVMRKAQASPPEPSSRP